MEISTNQYFGTLNTSASALKAQRTRMDAIASNLANVETTHTPQGGPYKRQSVIFESVSGGNQNKGDAPGNGVRVAEVVADKRSPMLVHMPGHPDADANGNVLLPDIRPAEEMADLISASRAFEANAAAFKISRSVFQKALELGRI